MPPPNFGPGASTCKPALSRLFWTDELGALTKIMTATKINDMETGVRQQPLSEEGAGRPFVEGSRVQGGLDSSQVEPDAVRSALFDEYWALQDLKGDSNLTGTQHNDGGYDSDSGIDEGLYGTPSLLLPLEARCSRPLNQFQIHKFPSRIGTRLPL